jgi:hypothetical protein
MGLDLFLEQHKAAIVKTWFERVTNSYAPDTANFYKSQKDQFANPVGTTLEKSLITLFEELSGDMDHKVITPLLDPMIRIRAVQDFNPSKAVAFIYDLKTIIHTKSRKKHNDTEFLQELLEFGQKIDTLALIAFDIYASCREKISQLKLSLEKNQVYGAFARAGLLMEVSEDEPQS